MRTHWSAINDFMAGKYFHKRLYEYYPHLPEHCKYVILPVISYGTSTSFRLQKETTTMNKIF